MRFHLECSIGWIGAITLALAAVVGAPGPAVAQIISVPETYVGDLSSRPALTGDWGGYRDELAKRGVWVDVNLLQVFQGVTSGGKSQDHDYGGSANYTLHMDTGKLGLWPGGFLTVFAESSFGGNVNGDTGGITPVTGAAFFPVPGEQTSTLTSVVFTQFLAKWFGVYLGKLYTLDGDPNEFADDYRTKFLNTAFDINMVGMRIVPYAGLGGGLVVLPWEGAIITAGVIDPNGTANYDAFKDPFGDGVTVTTSMRVAIKPFGLPGHQTVSYAAGTKEYVSLNQDPRSLLRNFIAKELVERFPRLGVIIPVADTRDLIERRSGSWAVMYNFDQYLWTTGAKATEGLGVFFRFGASDGNPNPIKYAYNVGLGGKGVVPGRPRDTYGVGWARTELSDEFLPRIRRRFNLGLNREDVIEIYYNAALTRWLNLTGDVQFVSPALGKTLESTPSGPQFKGLNDAVVFGLRLYAKF